MADNAISVPEPVPEPEQMLNAIPVPSNALSLVPANHVDSRLLHTLKKLGYVITEMLLNDGTPCLRISSSNSNPRLCLYLIMYADGKHTLKGIKCSCTRSIYNGPDKNIYEYYSFFLVNQVIYKDFTVQNGTRTPSECLTIGKAMVKIIIIMNDYGCNPELFNQFSLKYDESTHTYTN